MMRPAKMGDAARLYDSHSRLSAAFSFCRHAASSILRGNMRDGFLAAMLQIGFAIS